MQERNRNHPRIFRLKKELSAYSDEIFQIQCMIESLIKKLPEPGLSEHLLQCRFALNRCESAEKKILKYKQSLPEEPETFATHSLLSQNLILIRNQKELISSMKRCLQENSEARKLVRQIQIEAEAVLLKEKINRQKGV